MKRLASVLLLTTLGHAAGAPPLQEILARAGKAVENFWNEFSAVNCIEEVAQVKFGKDTKPVLRQLSSFDYLISLQLAGSTLTVEESRVPVKAAARTPERLPLLVTGGFSTLAFIFHPLFQSSFEYSPAEVEADGLWRLQFRHVRGARSPSVLRLRQREYPIEWQGTAWLDPESGSVVRIAAALGGSMDDIGLKVLSAEVTYKRFEFKQHPGLHWLPATATIEAETPRQHWRNTHSFTNYKHFSVTTRTETEMPK